MGVTAVTGTGEPLAQVQADISDLFSQLLQDWHTGRRRLWALGYDVSACANEAQMNGWADSEIGSTEESAIEDDYAWIRTGC